MSTSEPCGGDLCISPADLKMMGERIDAAERERDELRGKCLSLQAEVSMANTALEMQHNDLIARRGEIESLQAGAAEMREALEKAPHCAVVPANDYMQGIESAPVTPQGMAYAIEKQLRALVSPALSSSAGRDLLERVKEMEGLLRAVAQTPQKMQEMMRREGFVIDNLDDRWQKLAFTLYTKLAEQASDAGAILENGGE